MPTGWDYPAQGKKFERKIFSNWDDNMDMLRFACDDLGGNVGRKYNNTMSCNFYKQRELTVRGRAQAYANMIPATREKYVARDTACEAVRYKDAKPDNTNCNNANKALEDYLENLRRTGETSANAQIQEKARQAAGLKPGETPPAWFKQPVEVGYNQLFTADAKAKALDRIGKKTEKLNATLAQARIKLEAAKATVDVGVGVGKVCNSVYNRDDGCCCARHIYWENNCVWWGTYWTGCYKGGESIGKLNADWAGGDKLSCPADHPDRVDGLCYRSCPSTHPHHIKGMPYLCGRSADTDGAIRDQFNYDNYDKDDAEHAIKCAEAVIAKNQGQIEEHCGYDARSKSKAAWEDVGAKMLSGVTLGAWDIYNAIYNAQVDDEHKVNMNKQIYGHNNRGGGQYDEDGNYTGGEKGAGDLHIEGVIDAFMRVKDIATEEACVKAIDQKDLPGYLKYCPLFEEVKPRELDENGDPKIQAILPPELPHMGVDLSGNLNDPFWVNQRQTLPDWNVPDIPTFDESKLPEFPKELTDALPAWLQPSEQQDMIPKFYPNDLIVNPQAKANTAYIKPEKYNILDHPKDVLLAGAVLLAVLSF
jgi:hypothetical protein